MKATLYAATVLLALCAGPALADDDALPADLKPKVDATLKDLGCEGYEEAQQEEEGGIEIEDANCKMGRMDIKFDKDLQVMLISRY